MYTNGIRKILSCNKPGQTLEEICGVEQTHGYDVVNHNGNIYVCINKDLVAMWAKTVLTIDDFKC